MDTLTLKEVILIFVLITWLTDRFDSISLFLFELFDLYTIDHGNEFNLTKPE